MRDKEKKELEDEHRKASHNVTITAATIKMDGNVTTLAVTIKNNGSENSTLTGLAIQGQFNSTYTWSVKSQNLRGKGMMGGRQNAGRHYNEVSPRNDPIQSQ